jgi:hypothetical protein
VWCAERGQSKTRQVVEHGFEDTPRSAEEAEEVYQPQPTEYRHDPERAARTATVISASSASHAVHRPLMSSVGNRDPRNLAWPLAILLVIGLIIAGVYFATRTHEVTVQVDRFEWSRVINVDHFATVREGDWSVPAGGRYVSQEQRIHHYNRVLDHYETRTRQVQSGSERYVCGTTNNGNGTFSDRYCTRTTYRTETYREPVYRQDPVYRTYYHYDIDKWVPYRTVPTGGQNRSDPEPYWGELVLQCANQAVLGCERESGRGQQYLVFFEWYEGTEEERHEYRLEESRADWDAYDPNAEYSLTFNGLGDAFERSPSP